ncbi:MAG TPA: hypothetical protein VJI98_05645 [Candidatus Nanoarchaeia archaeon]|nr:hypothetical protein [Candidatus Nanoarchaeia archaeon]
MTKTVSGLDIDANFQFYITNLRGQDFKWNIPFKTYMKYRRRTRLFPNSNDNFRKFVTPTENIIKDIVRDIIIGNIESRLDYAQLVMDFVNRIPYQDRKEEYTKYPVETLCEFGGNCVDMSVLGATMLSLGGIETCFIDFPDHLALGVNIPTKGEYVIYRGEKYYVAEMSSTPTLSRDSAQIKIGDTLGLDLNEAKIYTARPKKS